MTNDKPDKTKIFNALIDEMNELGIIKRFNTKNQTGIMMTVKGLHYYNILDFMKKNGDTIENIPLDSDSVS